MKKIFTLLCFSLSCYAQGIYNNGATIVVTSGADIYIDGGTNGNYDNRTSGPNHGSIDLDGDIYVEGDWSNNAAAGTVLINIDTDGKVYMNGTAAQAFGGSAITDFEGLVIQNADKTLNKNIAVRATLDVDAVLDLNGNILIIKNSAANGITRTSDYIKSEKTSAPYSLLQWDMRETTNSYTIPFGNAAALYMPLTFNITSAGTESAVGQMEFGTYPTADDNTPYWTGVTNMNRNGADNSDNAMDRFWSINANNYSTAPTATVTFTYDANDLTGNDASFVEEDLFAQLYDGVANQWLAGAGSVNVVNNTVEVAGQAAFGRWALTRSVDPLPVELLTFTAICSNEALDLSWTTASEVNNEKFIIERSRNSIDFEMIDVMPGLGNSNSPHTYYYTDETAHEGIVYYRLKQVDYSGVFEYSDIISESCGEINELEVYNISYSSENQKLFLQFGMPSDNSLLNITVFNIQGKKIHSIKVDTYENINTIETPIYLLPGIYIISLHYRKSQVSTKLFIR